MIALASAKGSLSFSTLAAPSLTGQCNGRKANGFWAFLIPGSQVASQVGRAANFVPPKDGKGKMAIRQLPSQIPRRTHSTTLQVTKKKYKEMGLLHLHCLL
jgi:hypothetical protein